ncbi:hypothetical protein GGI16_001820 [Coemansia sp. S142-1]|nr:hypothetical protein GGI16_001820 [Coemansia sp. S142-1]
MPSLSLIQMLPPHTVEMIVEHVANNIRLASNKAHNISRSEEYGRLQMPLLWVCRNFRAVVYSRIFKCYSITFDSNLDTTYGQPCEFPRYLSQFRGHFYRTAREMSISINPRAVYSGKALGALSRVP